MGTRSPARSAAARNDPIPCNAGRSRSAIYERENLPWVGHTLELAGTTVFELQTRPCDQVAHRRADEAFTCAREGRHTGTGPSPTSWYATCRPLFFAYRVSGSVTVTRSPSRDASAAEEH